MATLNTKDANGNSVSLNLEHVVFTLPNGTVCCDGKMYSLTPAEVARINGYTKRRTDRVEAEAREAKVKKLAAAGRLLRLRAEAKVPFVSIARTFDLREDVFDAARNSTKAGVPFDNYEAAMMGGEPYSAWH